MKINQQIEPVNFLNLNSGAIHVENKTSIKQRLAWLFLAWKAIPVLKSLNQEDLSNKMVKIKVDLSEIKDSISYESNNHIHLRNLLEDLVTTKVTWNIFNKETNIWGASGLLAFFEIESRKDKAICTYSFSPFLQDKLANPEMYARINLMITKNITSKNTLAIYCIALDYLQIKNNFGQKHFTIEELKSYLNLKDNEYKNIGDFYKWIIKNSEEEINKNTDMDILIEPKREGLGKRSKIIGFTFKMKIKESFINFYKPSKIANSNQNKQLSLFEASQTKNTIFKKSVIKKEPEPKNLIKISNEKLRVFYAENNISMTTKTVQDKLVELKDTFQDRFENYLLFLMNYTNREDKRITIKSLSAFYIGLIKNDSQMENYFLYHQKQHEQEKEKLSKLDSLLELELKNQYNKHLANDFENYIIQNVDRLENKIIEILKSKLKPGDFFYDVIIQKTYSGIVDKTLITKAKESVRMMTISYLRDYPKELKYKPISFEDWKDEEISEDYIEDLKENLLKSF